MRSTASGCSGGGVLFDRVPDTDLSLICRCTVRP